MKKFIHWVDPYRQSFLYFQWNFWMLLGTGLSIGWLWVHIQGSFAEGLLNNVFVYLPNYLIHEFSHRAWCPWGWEWGCYASGNAVETLVPLAGCFLALRIKGGRYLLPVLLYWLATTLYGAGIYAADARAMNLPLTSSDMISTFEPGTVQGDWYYILEPLGLLQYDVLIGNILVFLSVVCVVLAFLSLWYYWTHTEQYLLEEVHSK